MLNRNCLYLLILVFSLNFTTNVQALPEDSLGNPDTSELNTIIVDDFGNVSTDFSSSAGVVEFLATDYEVNESDGNITVTINRVNGSNGVAEVIYSTHNGTAKGLDYIAKQNILRWIDGETEDKTITIGIYNDVLVEGTESFSIKLSTPTSYTQLGTNTEATISIIDNDVETTVQFTSESYLVTENDGVAIIKVTREGGRAGEVAVKYKIIDGGTATVDEDYVDAEGMFIWNSGNNAHQEIVISIKDDHLIEGNETIQLKLFDVEGKAILGVFGETTLTIIEDDTGECQSTEVIDCIWDNDGYLLEDVEITEYGQIIGGQLSGTIVNEGIIENVSLLADSHIIGGQTVGIIRGNIQGNPDNPTILDNVEIASDVILNHVIIGKNAIVNSGVILGDNVLFETNSTIPYMANLNSVLGHINATYLPAVNLNRDVLLNSSRNGIVDAINSLLNTIDLNPGFVLTQNLENGALEFDTQGQYYKILPTNVQQVWGQQTINNHSLEAMGIVVETSGELIVVTHTGRKINLIPMVHDFEALKDNLAIFNLHHNILRNINGNLKVLNADDYYTIRPNLFSQPVAADTALGIRTINSTWVDNLVEVFSVFEINDQELHQQFLYSSAAHSEILEAQAAGVQLYLDGRAKLFIGEGVDTKVYRGVFDYAIITDTDAEEMQLQILEIEDINNDTLTDYRIIYPNGDQQIFYQCLHCIE
ncbi:MAG: hypothetical protein KAH84_01795 [Thiomargarita sp.]|nr:hypothetical protein [Thiomargarita sp.]